MVAVSSYGSVPVTRGEQVPSFAAGKVIAAVVAGLMAAALVAVVVTGSQVLHSAFSPITSFVCVACQACGGHATVKPLLAGFSIV